MSDRNVKSISSKDAEKEIDKNNDKQMMHYKDMILSKWLFEGHMLYLIFNENILVIQNNKTKEIKTDIAFVDGVMLNLRLAHKVEKVDNEGRPIGYMKKNVDDDLRKEDKITKNVNNLVIIG